MEINTILLISSIIFQGVTVIFGECRKSKCTDIEISDCIKIHRDLQNEGPTL